MYNGCLKFVFNGLYISSEIPYQTLQETHFSILPLSRLIIGPHFSSLSLSSLHCMQSEKPEPTGPYGSVDVGKRIVDSAAVLAVEDESAACGLVVGSG